MSMRAVATTPPYRRRRRRPPMRAVTTAAAAAATAAAAVTTLLVLPPSTYVGALQVIVSAGVPPFPSPGPQYTLALPSLGGTVPPGGRPLADADEAVPVGLTTPSGQHLRCEVPVERPPGGEAVAAAARRARAASRGALFDGIETLLSAYEGLCFLRLEGWWTYEFCYGSSVIQRHIPRDGEEETSYTLGLAQPPVRGAGGAESMPGDATLPRDRDADATAAAGVDASGSEGGAGGASPTPDEGRRSGESAQGSAAPDALYTNGTPCDLSDGTPRRVTIRYLCSTALHGPLATRVTPPGEGTSSGAGGGTGTRSGSGGGGGGGTPSTREGAPPSGPVTAHYIAAIREPASCVYELDFVNDAVCAHEAYAQEDTAGGAKTVWCTLEDEEEEEGGGGGGDGPAAGARVRGRPAGRPGLGTSLEGGRGFRGFGGSRFGRASFLF
ncbi:hypothetical protein MMPV_004859 [Pyropia vietnamensis]